MCRDCGCEQGNERAWFGHGERAAGDHPGAHDHPHPHDHEHEPGHPHPHEHGHEPGPPHRHHHHPPGGVIHVHVPAGAEVHLHFEGRSPQRIGPGAETGAGDRRRARRIELETRVLAENDRLAAANRALLEQHGAVALNLISSPGSGKTTLLERTLEALGRELPIGVIVGDQQTDRDARRLAGHGVPVEQIETRSACHLDAAQVRGPLGRMLDRGARLVLIENVGNLVCPAAFDLGEHRKIALLSVTEGEDKPLKYPVLFHDAPLVVITKLDLAERAAWDRKACYRAIHAVRADARVIELSARTGEGLDAWLAELRGALAGVAGRAGR